MARRRRIRAEMRVLAGVFIAVGLLAAGCASNQSAARTTGTGVSLMSPRAEQIARARASNDLFSIFPANPGEQPCRIPEGGVHFKPLRGECRTSVHESRIHEPRWVVSFTETWKFPPCPPQDDCLSVRFFRHTWRVI